MNRNMTKTILVYGEKYRRDLLLGRGLTKEKLLEDWRVALRFFFSKAFYQGRTDIISARVEKAALEVLEPTFARADLRLGDWDLECISKPCWRQTGREQGRADLSKYSPILGVFRSAQAPGVAVLKCALRSPSG